MSEVTLGIKGTVFFVSNDGNDAWSGKFSSPNAEKTDGPFATIVRARNAVRELKGKQPLSEPVTVMLRNGTHFLDAPVIFDRRIVEQKIVPLITWHIRERNRSSAEAKRLPDHGNNTKIRSWSVTLKRNGISTSFSSTVNDRFVPEYHTMTIIT
jgi:hypothetical protein